MVRQQNRLLLEATFLHDDEDDSTSHEHGQNLSHTRKLAAVELLLDMSSGSFSSDVIVHHCRIGCCKNSAETLIKLWLAIEVGSMFVTICMFSL